MPTQKLWWFLAAFLSGMALAMFAEELILSSHENRLEFAPHQIHFLTGQPLMRLRNAEEVPFDFQVTLWSGNHNHIFRRNAEQFVVNYDIWEEKFQVTKTKAPRKTVSNLTVAGVETWCTSQVTVDLSGLGNSEKFWARFEVRAENSSEDSGLFGRGSVSDAGISLTKLIEIFSRPPARDQVHWALEAGPLTLDELKRRGGS